MSFTVFLGNLPTWVTADDIKQWLAAEDLVAEQAAFGCNREEIAMVLKPMATDAKEPTFSMGDDTPFAAVATRARPVYGFLKQRFAQVSNPPIDHLRERLVMSLRTCIGPKHPLLLEDPASARLLELRTFFLYPDAVAGLLDATRSPFRAERLDATFAVSRGDDGLEAGIDALVSAGLAAVRDGAAVLIVSDASISDERAPIPSLLALGALHHALVEARVRQAASLVIDSGDARDTHSIACLLGYGADAISPRVALATVAAMADDDQLGELHSADAQAKLQAAIEDGVLKILEDGDLDGRWLPRRSDLRSARSRPRGRRYLPERHDVHRRRPRFRRARC